MKSSKKQLHQQRSRVDDELIQWKQVKTGSHPRKGWLRAIRESLGITTRQLAELLGTDNAGVLRLEEREMKGTVTLQTLERAAKAMGCHLIYAIVPEHSLEKTLDKKAHEAALKILKPVAHTMRLEKQSVPPAETEKQIDALAKELKENLNPLLWKK